MKIVYQGSSQLEEMKVKKDTMIIFREKWIELIKINDVSVTTIPLHLIRTIQEK